MTVTRIAILALTLALAACGSAPLPATNSAGNAPEPHVAYTSLRASEALGNVSPESAEGRRMRVDLAVLASFAGETAAIAEALRIDEGDLEECNGVAPCLAVIGPRLAELEREAGGHEALVALFSRLPGETLELALAVDHAFGAGDRPSMYAALFGMTFLYAPKAPYLIDARPEERLAYLAVDAPLSCARELNRHALGSPAERARIEQEVFAAGCLSSCPPGSTTCGIEGEDVPDRGFLPFVQRSLTSRIAIRVLRRAHELLARLDGAQGRLAASLGAGFTRAFRERFARVRHPLDLPAQLSSEGLRVSAPRAPMPPATAPHGATWRTTDADLYVIVTSSTIHVGVMPFVAIDGSENVVHGDPLPGRVVSVDQGAFDVAAFGVAVAAASAALAADGGAPASSIRLLVDVEAPMSLVAGVVRASADREGEAMLSLVVVHGMRAQSLSLEGHSGADQAAVAELTLGPGTAQLYEPVTAEPPATASPPLRAPRVIHTDPMGALMEVSLRFRGADREGGRPLSLTIQIEDEQKAGPFIEWMSALFQGSDSRYFSEVRLRPRASGSRE